MAFKIDKLTGELIGININGSGSSITLPIAQSDVSGLSSSLSAKVDTSKIGVAGGVASTDANNLLDTKHLPTSILNGLKWQGVWNASTNSPAIPAAVAGNAGYFYKVSVAGTSSITGSSVNFAVGDWLISKGTAWERVPSYEAVQSVNTKTGSVSLSASDIQAFPLSSVIAKGDILVGTGVGTVERVPAGVDGQLLGYDSTQSTGIKAVSVSTSGGGGSPSYLRVTGTGEQTISSAGTIIQFPTTVINTGLDISVVSNCFLLRAGKTYRLLASTGGVSFTTTGNSYFYAQWRTGQTGGSGTLLGQPANMEASTQAPQNCKVISNAFAEYTATVDTWVHVESINVGTVCNIGCNSRASAWIEVISGNTPVTGQSVDYIQCVPSNRTTNGDVSLTKASGNMVLATPLITLAAGKTYYLSAFLSFRDSTYAVWKWQDSTGVALSGITFGNSAGFSSADPLAPAPACGFYTPSTNIQVKVVITSITGASAMATDMSSITIQQIGTSTVTPMVGATASVIGIGGTVPAPGIGKHESVFKGDGTYSSGLLETATGFVKIGATAPAIKMKKLTGTAAAVNNATQINHGLTQSKIISYTVQVLDSNGSLVQSGYSGAASMFSTYISGTQVIISTGSSATQIAGRPITVLITYEE